MYVHASGEGAYMETYLIAGANAIEYLPEKPRGFKGAVEVQILIVEGDKVVNFDKYQLNTPIVYDTNAINFSIMDQNVCLFRILLFRWK